MGLRLLEGIQDLLRLSRQAADTESQLGPAWILDQSLTAIEALSQLESAAIQGTLKVGPNFSFREHLGALWVDLHGEIHALCERLDGLVRSGKLDV